MKSLWSPSIAFLLLLVPVALGQATCNDFRINTPVFTPSIGNHPSVRLAGTFVTATSYALALPTTVNDDMISVTFGSAIFTANPFCSVNTTSGNFSITATSPTGFNAMPQNTVNPGSTLTWSCEGPSAGPRREKANDLTVTTKRHSPSRGNMPQLGGIITIGTTLTLASGDLVGNKQTEAAVSIVFTAANAMPSGSTITITTPFNYFIDRGAAAAAGTSTITCVTACTSVTVGNVAVVNTAASGSTPAFGTITVVTGGAATTGSQITLSLGIGTFTTGAPLAATGTTNGITVTTTRDRVSAGAASTVIGGQITIGTSLTLASANARGVWVTTAPVSIVFTSPSGIPQSGTITINTPYNYFQTRTAAASATGSTITCASACGGVTVGNVAVINTLGPFGNLTGATGVVQVIISGAAVTSGAVTLSLAAGTLATMTPMSGNSAGVSVQTTRDRVSAGAALQATALAVCPAPPAITPSTSNELLLSAVIVFACLFTVL